MEQPSPSGSPRTHALLAWAIGCSTFLHFWARMLADPDMWGHLEWGRGMLRTGSFLRHDTHSYTAAGLPFYDHEWLADVVFAACFDLLGTGGLLALKLGFGVVMMAAILDAVRTLSGRVGVPASATVPLAGALVISLAVIAPGATFRPQLATMAGLAVQWALLERASTRLRDDGTVGWQAFCIAPLLVVWANAHGGFLVGVALMGLFVASACLWLLMADRRPTRWRAIAYAALAGLAALAAPIANPYGIELYTYLAATIDQHAGILEWDPVPVLTLTFLRFKLLVAVTITACVALFARNRSWDAAWRVTFLTLATWMAFKHQRHTVVFAIAAAPVVGVAALVWGRDLLARWPGYGLGFGARRAVAVGLAMLAGIQIGGVAGRFAVDGLTIPFTRVAYPIDAVTFLEAHDFRGNILVPFDWGSYTAHKMSDRMKVFVDGRFEAVFPREVLDDYFAFASGAEGWERALDEYPTEIVVTARQLGTHEHMFGRGDFHYVYSDPTAFVFVRRTPRTSEALDRIFQLAQRPRLPVPPSVFP